MPCTGRALGKLGLKRRAEPGDYFGFLRWRKLRQELFHLTQDYITHDTLYSPIRCTPYCTQAGRDESSGDFRPDAYSISHTG